MKDSCLLKKFKQMSWTFTTQPAWINYSVPGCKKGNLGVWTVQMRSKQWWSKWTKPEILTRYHLQQSLWFLQQRLTFSQTLSKVMEDEGLVDFLFLPQQEDWCGLSSCRAGQWMHQQRETMSHNSAVNTALHLIYPLFPAHFNQWKMGLLTE